MLTIPAKPRSTRLVREPTSAEVARDPLEHALDVDDLGELLGREEAGPHRLAGGRAGIRDRFLTRIGLFVSLPIRQKCNKYHILKRALRTKIELYP